MSSSTSKSGHVRAGSFCTLGDSGQTAPGKDGRPGTPMRCTETGDGKRARWRKAAGAVSASRVRKREPRTPRERAADKLRQSELNYLRKAAGLPYEGALPRNKSQRTKLETAGFTDPDGGITDAGREALRRRKALDDKPATPTEDRSAASDVDWSRYEDCYRTCKAPAGTPCIDLRDGKSFNATPHDGRRMYPEGATTPATGDDGGPVRQPGGDKPINIATIVNGIRAGHNTLHRLQNDWFRTDLSAGRDSVRMGAREDGRSSSNRHLRNEVKAGIDNQVLHTGGNPLMNTTDLFVTADTPAPAERPLEDRVRDAVDELAKRPGGPVALADLREKLSDVSREDLDKALLGMDDARDVQLEPDPDRAGLTDRDREGAIPLVGRDQHLIRRVQKHDQAADETKLRAAQDRQAGIDTARAAAKAAATEDESRFDEGNPSPSPHWGQAEKAGAARVGNAGDVEAFDPTRHDVLGERPTPGDDVTILRPGSRWTGDDPVVMEKPLVVAGHVGQPEDRSAAAGTDWSQYRSCGACGTGSGAPCLDLRGDGSLNATPHPGRSTVDPTVDPAAAAPSEQIADDIRAVIDDMSADPAYAPMGDDSPRWIMLSRLRERLSGRYSRGQVDAALKDLTARDVIDATTEANQKTLRDVDRAAAIRLGGENMHLVARTIPTRPRSASTSAGHVPEDRAAGAPPAGGADETSAQTRDPDREIPLTQDEARIRDAYQRLASGPGDWVGVGDLRAAVSDMPDNRFADAVRASIHQPDAQVEEQTNQKILTVAERAAAVNIGGRDQHLFAINPEWAERRSPQARERSQPLPLVDRSQESGTDWSRFDACHRCSAGPAEPCYDLSGTVAIGSYNATPHDGRPAMTVA